MVDISSLQPFEICSIRPPTENNSLTFRLTRNCAWNRCMFCPVYKGGVRFSRRSIDEIKEDVRRAAVLDAAIRVRGVGRGDSFRQAYDKVRDLLDAAASEREARQETREQAADPGDERLQWFSSWFKDAPTLKDSIMNLLGWRIAEEQTCFLGDANSLLLPSDFFTEALLAIKTTFPEISRFTIYGRTRSAVKKTPQDLAGFARAGLHRIHFGIESGSDKVLAFMHKGETGNDHIEACRKTREAGMSPSVYVMPGLGGRAWSDEHALETARILSEGRPDFVRLRSLEVFPGTGLGEAIQRGEFEEASEEQVAAEIRTMIANTDGEMTIMSDSASSLLDVNGRLPEDRADMLATVDRYLDLSPRDKLSFSLVARLQSFTGQYGGLSQDILRALRPYLTREGLNIAYMADEEMAKITRLVRSKLMP